MAPLHRPDACERRAGYLVIIGGNEDREHDKLVLRRFVELAAPSNPRILLLAAGARDGASLCRAYAQALAELGAGACSALELPSREQANDARLADRVFDTDAVFLIGSEGRRLLSMLGGTAVHMALQQAHAERELCVAGTAAGAGALAQHMLLDGGDARPHPASHALVAGLGLVRSVLIDPQFSERQRLGRLLNVVAGNPTLIGMGIDEDTAVVLDPHGGIEVVGDGAVTLLDGRRMASNFIGGALREALELIDVKLHLLPAGTRYSGPGAPPARREVPASLRDIVSLIAGNGSMLS